MIVVGGVNVQDPPSNKQQQQRAMGLSCTVGAVSLRDGYECVFDVLYSIHDANKMFF
jgi:hypothetical protein